MNNTTLAEALNLPAGWRAERYIATTELFGPTAPGSTRNLRATIPNPYTAQPVEWWREEAAKAVAEAR